MRNIFLIYIVLLVFSCEGVNDPVEDSSIPTQNTDSSDDSDFSDSSCPVITGFTLVSNSTVFSADVQVSISDDGTVSSWIITTSNAEPALDDSAWQSSCPTCYTLPGFGTHQLYVWGKNSSDDISAVFQSISVEYLDVNLMRPGNGDILVTEIMYDPSNTADSEGEWIELYNASDRDLYLKDCIFKDADTNSFTITGDIVMESHSYIVYGNSNTVSEVDYVYSGYTLHNSVDEVIIEYNGTVICSVYYDDTATFPICVGASMELNPLKFSDSEAGHGSNWREASTAFSTGDLGTPGEPNTTW